MDTIKEHEVWRILNKNQYTNEGIESAENIYNFLKKELIQWGLSSLKKYIDISIITVGKLLLY